MQPDKNTIPKSFYGSGFALVKIPALSYRAYCTARDSWLDNIPQPCGMSILDIGCSTGAALARWTQNNTLTGVDHEPTVLNSALAHGYKDVLVADMFNLPWKQPTFDAAVAMGMLGSARDPKINLRNFNALLRNDGKLYLAVAIYGGIRVITRAIVNVAKVPNQMVNIPTLKTLESDLRKCGFEIESLATSPLYPFARVTFNPSPLHKRMAAYAFVIARKTRDACP